MWVSQQQQQQKVDPMYESHTWDSYLYEKMVYALNASNNFSKDGYPYRGIYYYYLKRKKD